MPRSACLALLLLLPACDQQPFTAGLPEPAEAGDDGGQVQDAAGTAPEAKAPEAATPEGAPVVHDSGSPTPEAEAGHVDTCTVGGTVYAHYSVDPSNPCLWCEPAISTAEWSALPNGTACNHSMGYCQGGACMVDMCGSDGNGSCGTNQDCSMCAPVLGGGTNCCGPRNDAGVGTCYATTQTACP